MHANSYEETVDWLFQQFPSYQLIGSKAYKPTLENISKLCERIGNPEKALRFLHIAGTNGKGSCSAMLASVLTESGETVGLFTSPHIIDFRERIRVNGSMITEENVVSFVKRIQAEELDFEPSFFEITFAMALDHFQRSACTVCVIETGLGGRLDATNIIEPIACLITNISLEHTQILGNSLPQIATEKAGIIKTNKPVVIGEIVPKTEPIFREIALSKNAKLHTAQELISKERLDQFTTPLLGSYQQDNLRSVLSLFKVIGKDFPSITDTCIQQGLNNLQNNTGFFGRMQVVQRDPLVIFDVSHNYDGVKATLDYITTLVEGELYILYGSSSDKDVFPIVELFPEDAHINLTTFNNQRSLSRQQLDEIALIMKKNVTIHENASIALEKMRSSIKKEDTILVFGSFFLLSDLMK